MINQHAAIMACRLMGCQGLLKAIKRFLVTMQLAQDKSHTGQFVANPH